MASLVVVDSSCLDALLAVGFRLGPSVYEAIVVAAGETPARES